MQLTNGVTKHMSYNTIC